MQKAYVLINCDAGTEKTLIEQLKHLNNVKEVHGTLGVYDIVAKIESEKPETLRQAIIGDIRKLDHVRSTLTLMGVEEIGKGEKMAELIPDIIPEEKKPLEPPTGVDEEEEFDEEDDEFEDDDEFTKK